MYRVLKIEANDIIRSHPVQVAVSLAVGVAFQTAQVRSEVEAQLVVRAPCIGCLLPSIRRRQRPHLAPRRKIPTMEPLLRRTSLKMGNRVHESESERLRP